MVNGPDPNNTTDSHGVPWAGRELTDNPFAGDDGATPPAVADALARFADNGHHEIVLDALAGESRHDNNAAGARLLVPVVAVLTEESTAVAHGPGDVELSADKGADMAMVTIASPDGRQAMPVFTSLKALTTWKPKARPVPVGARRVALSAVNEGCELLVLNPGTAPTVLFTRPALWALAQGTSWIPSYRNTAVLHEINNIAERAEGVAFAQCAKGQQAELRITLALPDPASSEDAVQRFSEALSESQLVADLVDSIEFAFVQT